MSTDSEQLEPVLYLPHGGGPLPLLGEPGHAALTAFLNNIPETLGEPAAILVISAHWEEERPAITGGARPELIYDYYGFPPESYAISYPAPGDPGLAEAVRELLDNAGFIPRLDERRGFDHGLFVPLKLMYPAARIPCLQVSLLANLDPAAHIALGKALAPLRARNVLVIGSGMSFHNMRMLVSPDADSDGRDVAFDDWLGETCTDPTLSADARERRLVEWDRAPGARFCHPREEHLLPLHVCYGVACTDTPLAEAVFNQRVLGQQVSGFVWRQPGRHD